MVSHCRALDCYTPQIDTFLMKYYSRICNNCSVNSCIFRLPIALLPIVFGIIWCFTLLFNERCTCALLHLYDTIKYFYPLYHVKLFCVTFFEFPVFHPNIYTIIQYTIIKINCSAKWFIYRWVNEWTMSSLNKKNTKINGRPKWSVITCICMWIKPQI